MKNHNKLIIVSIVFLMVASVISFKTVRAQDSGLHGMDLFYSTLAQVVGAKMEVPSLEAEVPPEDGMLGYSRATKRIEYVYDFRNGLNVNGAILPDKHNSVDIGSFDLAFNQIFASGTSYIQNLVVSGTLTFASSTALIGSASTTNLTVAGYANFDGPTYLGNATSDDILIRGRIAADIDSKTNNTYDLGASGLAWKDIFASGTVDIGGVTADGQSGNVTIGTSTGGDLTITNRLAADLDPKTVNAYDLGSHALTYKDLYASSTAFLGSATTTMIEPWANNASPLGTFTRSWSGLFVSGTSHLSATTLSGDLDPTTNNARDLGLFTLAWNDIFVSGTSWLGVVNVAGDLDPNTHNTRDLGASGLAWNDVFASGTVHAATSTIVNMTGTSTIFATSSGGYGGRLILGTAGGGGCVELYFSPITGLVSSTITCPAD